MKVDAEEFIEEGFEREDIEGIINIVLASIEDWKLKNETNNSINMGMLKDPETMKELVKRGLPPHIAMIVEMMPDKNISEGLDSFKENNEKEFDLVEKSLQSYYVKLNLLKSRM